MVDVPRNPQTLDRAKMQELLDQAVDVGADAVTIEFSIEGGLEVLFVFGNTSVGDIFVDHTLETEDMTLISERAGLKEKPTGVLHWESKGQNLEIRVEEYNSFGEIAYILTFPKGQQ